MTLISHAFGTLPDGNIATLYHLSYAEGIEFQFTNYGATMVALTVPNRFGERTDVILGYDSLEQYQRQNYCVGGIMGRFANRIQDGRFAIEGRPYQVTVNNPPHHLHGGRIGFHQRHWRTVATADYSVTMEYHSPDGEEGYPGNVTARVTYTLTDAFTLRVDLSATTDQPTIVNLTAHPYFNLAGRGDVLNHLLTIPTDLYTPVDSALIPTGEIASVADTTLDFRTPTLIGEHLRDEYTPLTYGKGYDQNFVLKRHASPDLVLAAHLADPASGRTMTLYSTAPGLQLYSGNHLANVPEGKNGAHYFHHCAVALEPQAFPDAPNHPNFPAALVTPDSPYHETIVYTFGTDAPQP